MRIEHYHQHSNEETCRRVNAYFEKLEGRHLNETRAYSRNWNMDNSRMDFSISARGIDVSGNFQLVEGLVIFEGKIPPVPKFIRKKVISLVEKKLEDIL
jgi:hypothetical protein